MRQMLASVEREHRDAIQRIQERADEEVERAEEKAAEAVVAVAAEVPGGGSIAPFVEEHGRSGGMGPSLRVPAQLTPDADTGGDSPSAFASPARRLRGARSGTGGGGSGVGRGAVVEAQLELMQKDYAVLSVSNE